MLVLLLASMASGLVVSPTMPSRCGALPMAMTVEPPVVATTTEEEPVVVVVDEAVESATPPPPPSKPMVPVDSGSLRLKRFAGCERSAILPDFLARPPLLDGSHAGDRGFDPLGVVKSREDLYTMMEAEVRHCRLAMLCAVGWPLSELNPAFDGALLASNGRAPSVLNGHFFDSPSFLVTALFFAELARREVANLSEPKKSKLYGHVHSQDYAALGDEWPYGVPGDENFDPLGLYGLLGKDPIGRFVMRDLELEHGRVAMLAVLLYVVVEASTGQPVVKLTPWLF